MAEGCGGGFAKMMLIVFNVLFWLSGAALIGIGIWLIVDSNALDEIDQVVKLTDSELIRYSAYLLLGVGAFVFIVAFIGCCGAFKENRCLLTIYIILLFLVLAGELAGGVLAFIYRNKIKEEMGKTVTKKMTEAKYPTDSFWSVMDLVQSQFRCCGLNSSEDYIKTQFKVTNNVPTDYPYSCCPLKATYKPADNVTAEMVTCTDGAFPKGCEKEIIDLAEDKLLVLIGIGIGLAVFQIFMFIFAICLCRRAEPKS